uniref:Uncharacterized protein n=1 Tax=Arundo donax TaxID=35708 RepID=A0A0A8Z8Z9_ARUDO
MPRGSCRSGASRSLPAAVATAAWPSSATCSSAPSRCASTAPLSDSSHTPADPFIA